jgi:hypothetical protein
MSLWVLWVATLACLICAQVIGHLIEPALRQVKADLDWLGRQLGEGIASAMARPIRHAQAVIATTGSCGCQVCQAKDGLTSWRYVPGRGVTAAGPACRFRIAPVATWPPRPSSTAGELLLLGVLLPAVAAALILALT